MVEKDYGLDFESLQVDSLTQFLFQAMFGSDENLPLLSSCPHIAEEKSNKESKVEIFRHFGYFVISALT